MTLVEKSKVFEIEAPQIYRCNVMRYKSNLSQLYVRVFKGMSEAPSFYLLFNDVAYFDGPMNWRGVDLRRDSHDACLQLMQQVGMVQDFMLDDPETRQMLEEVAHLYMFHTPHTIIRVIAGSAVKLDDTPEDMN